VFREKALLGESQFSQEEVRIELRVPGPWRSSTEVLEALHAPRATNLWRRGKRRGQYARPFSDSAAIRDRARDHDDICIEIFTDLHHRPTDEELEEIEKHAVKIHSPERRISRRRPRDDGAATALVRAGGAGVLLIPPPRRMAAATGWTWRRTKSPAALLGIYRCVGAGRKNLLHRDAVLGFPRRGDPRAHRDPNFAGFVIINFWATSINPASSSRTATFWAEKWAGVSRDLCAMYAFAPMRLFTIPFGCIGLRNMMIDYVIT